MAVFTTNPLHACVHTQVLEKHLIQLLNRLDGFEHVREQLELQERPSSLIESRDSVRRHVDAQDIIAKVSTHVRTLSKNPSLSIGIKDTKGVCLLGSIFTFFQEDLDCECEAVSHSIGKLRPCSNPDFIGESTPTHTHLCINLHLVCVCVCVCV